MSYDDACKAAAAHQGLDPLMERLTSEGIDFVCEQTGGFCMVVYVTLGNGYHIGLTRDGGWIVCLYDADYEWIENSNATFTTLDRVVELLHSVSAPYIVTDAVHYHYYGAPELRAA